MKRKEIINLIDEVGAKTFVTCGSMKLLNKKSGAEVEVDMHSVFSVVRGTLAWVCTLLDGRADPEKNTAKHLQDLLEYIGSSIALDISDDDED
ncbi:MAG: hypothetical protein U0N89_04055 [Collinsella intestinalis]